MHVWVQEKVWIFERFFFLIFCVFSSLFDLYQFCISFLLFVCYYVCQSKIVHRDACMHKTVSLFLRCFISFTAPCLSHVPAPEEHPFQPLAEQPSWSPEEAVLELLWWLLFWRPLKTSMQTLWDWYISWIINTKMMTTDHNKTNNVFWPARALAIALALLVLAEGCCWMVIICGCGCGCGTWITGCWGWRTIGWIVLMAVDPTCTLRERERERETDRQAEWISVLFYKIHWQPMMVSFKNQLSHCLGYRLSPLSFPQYDAKTIQWWILLSWA